MLARKELSKTESPKESGIFCYRHSDMREIKCDQINKETRVEKTAL